MRELVSDALIAPFLGRPNLLRQLLHKERVLQEFGSSRTLLLRALRHCQESPEVMGTHLREILQTAGFGSDEAEKLLVAVLGPAANVRAREEGGGAAGNVAENIVTFLVGYMASNHTPDLLFREVLENGSLAHPLFHSEGSADRLRALIRSLGPERFVQEIGIEEICRHLDVARVVDSYGLPTVLGSIPAETAFEFYGSEGCLAHVGDLIRSSHTARQTLLAAIEPNDPLLKERILATDSALMGFLTDERVVRRALSSEVVRDKYRFADSKSRASSIPYDLPAVVLSYPRSGSNFLQTILQASTGLNNQSIYASFREPKEATLTVKSHAPSYDYLLDEFGRIVQQPPAPQKVILVQRDPRDVMISFLEYTEHNRKIAIPQKDFLKRICFFYASTIDPDSQRKVLNFPMSILEAYRLHVREWFAHPPGEVEIISVRFEDLVEKPAEQFERLFEFLDCDGKLAAEFLQVRVSQYSQSRRERGKAGGWRDHRDEYADFLATVHEELSSEIQQLGYDLD